MRKTPVSAANPHLPDKFPAQNCGKKVCAPSEFLGTSPRNGLLSDRRLQPRVPLFLRDARPLALGRFPDGGFARVFPESPKAFRYGRPARGGGFLRQRGICKAPQNIPRIQGKPRGNSGKFQAAAARHTRPLRTLRARNRIAGGRRGRRPARQHRRKVETARRNNNHRERRQGLRAARLPAREAAATAQFARQKLDAPRPDRGKIEIRRPARADPRVFGDCRGLGGQYPGNPRGGAQDRRKVA